ncbi:PKD domain-containing protein [Candidatus Parabeggiatoa sp. HSG14]|uniref:PKD domain-containing protein n=1 Tax=Candidatus Parabeggiatoa sp. HSG14 TaxID=3055593 RepID=UPI0025A76694|nr:PKD domain-containing protein [Thiotrichales bacterium HSG14]
MLNITNKGPETDVQIDYSFSPSMEIGEIIDCTSTTCSLSEFAVDSTSVITIPITVPNTVLDVESDKITLTVSNGDNTVTNEDVSILKPDLSISSVTPSANQVLAGQGLSYDLAVTNDGNGAATGVKIQYEFPNIPNMVMGEITGAGWECDKPTATCELVGNLSAGTTASAMTLPITTPDTVTGPLKIVATVNGTNEPTGDTKPDENVTIFPAEADLSMTQTVSDEAVVEDGNFRYNLVVSNEGPDTAQNVSTEIELLGNSEYVTAIGDWDCSNVGQIVTCNLASLANSANSALSIEVKGKNGSINNNATVISAALDPDDTDNRSSSQNVVVFTYDVSPDTEVAPDTIMLKANSAVEDITFCWNSGDKWAVGEETTIELESDGVSYLSLSVNNGEIGANCEIVGDTREIKRINNIMVTLDPNIPPAAYLEVTPQSLAAPGSVNLNASHSTDSRNEQSGSGINGYQFSHNGVMIPNDGSWLNVGIYDLGIGVGFHTFTAFVKDSKGAISTATSQVIVGDSDIPLADFNFTADRMEAPAAITLSAETNATITSYEFTVTDPNGLPINLNSELTNPNVNVTFPIIGNYRVSLKVTNLKGEFSETSRDIYIGSTGIPIVNARVSPTKGQQPHIVRLTAGFLDPDGQPYKSCVWTIKDLNNTVIKNCDEIETYTFSEVGKFAVELKAFDVEDEFGIDSKIVDVYAPGTPVPTVDIIPLKGFSSLTVTAVASAIDPNPMDEVSFLWNSPNGAISEPQKERTNITFTGVGEYDVTVTAKDDSIAELSATSPERKVTVVAVPKITTNATVGCKALIVNFGIDSNPDIDYFQYNWSSDKGQPESANEPNTNITFPINESAVVTLKVTDNNGTEKVITKTVSTVCDNVVPIANMAFVTEAVKGFAPFTVTVKNQGSYDPDNTKDPLLFRWIADTAHSIALPTAAETAITFRTVGTHNIALEVGDSIATTLSTLKTVEVIAPPQIKASATEVCPSTSVNLSVPQEQGFSYLWSSASLPDINNTTSALTVAAEQSFMMNLQITDANGTQVNVPKQITVLPASSEQCTDPVDPVQAVIMPVPPQIQVGQNLHVDGSISTGPVVRYEWSTTDGQQCTTEICDFTFATAGTQIVTLKVYDNEGSPSGATVSVDVIPLVTKPVQAVIIPIPSQIQINQSLSVNGSTSTGPIVNYAWSTSDGQTCASKLCPLTFTSVGTKNITLTVSGDGGGITSSATVSVEVVAEPIPLKAIIIPVPSQIQVNESLSIDGSTSTGSIVSYAWSTSDGQTCALQICPFTFTSIGTKNITLTVSGDGETPSSATVSVNVIQSTIETPPPVPTVGIADKNLNPDDGSKPTLTLNAGNNPDIAQYKWIIRDKDNKIVSEKYSNKPTFFFDEPGDFTIELVVKGKNGIDSEPVVVKNVNVPVQIPPEFPDVETTSENLAPSDGSKPTLTLDAGNNPDIAEYKWTVRDANGQVVSKSDESKPTFSFDNSGDFTVDLTVKGKNGKLSKPKQVKKVTVPIPPVVVVSPTFPVVGIDKVEFLPDGNGKAIKKVTLDAGENPEIIEYKWTVTDKDGNVVGEEYNNKPTFFLDEPGKFNVNLTVKDKNDLVGGPKKVMEISGPPAQPSVPDVQAIYNGLNADGNKKMTLKVAEDNPNVEYEWKTSDGKVLSGKDVEFLLAEGDEPFVDLTIRDKRNGATTVERINLIFDSEKGEIVVIPQGEIVINPPLENLAAIIKHDRQQKSEIYGTVPFKLILDGSGSIGKIKDKDYVWKTDDTNATTGPEYTRTFDSSGIYEISLTVWEDANTSHLARVTVIVNPKNVQAVITHNGQRVSSKIEDIIPFDLTLDGSGSEGEVVSYEWAVSGEVASEDKVIYTKTFNLIGEYEISLTVCNQENKCDSTRVDVVVKEPPPLDILVFELLNDGKTGGEYYPGNILELQLNVNLHDGVECTEADLWVAIFPPAKLVTDMKISPSSPYLFFHKDGNNNPIFTFRSDEVESIKPQKYMTLINPESRTLELLNITMPEIPKGEYIFYAGLVKTGKDPLETKPFEEAFCVNPNTGDMLLIGPFVVKVKVKVFED